VGGGSGSAAERLAWMGLRDEICSGSGAKGGVEGMEGDLREGVRGKSKTAERGSSSRYVVGGVRKGRER